MLRSAARGLSILMTLFFICDSVLARDPGDGLGDPLFGRSNYLLMGRSKLQSRTRLSRNRCTIGDKDVTLKMLGDTIDALRRKGFSDDVIVAEIMDSLESRDSSWTNLLKAMDNLKKMDNFKIVSGRNYLPTSSIDRPFKHPARMRRPGSPSPHAGDFQHIQRNGLDGPGDQYLKGINSKPTYPDGLRPPADPGLGYAMESGTMQSVPGFAIQDLSELSRKSQDQSQLFGKGYVQSPDQEQSPSGSPDPEAVGRTRDGGERFGVVKDVGRKESKESLETLFKPAQYPPTLQEYTSRWPPQRYTGPNIILAALPPVRGVKIEVYLAGVAHVQTIAASPMMSTFTALYQAALKYDSGRHTATGPNPFEIDPHALEAKHCNVIGRTFGLKSTTKQYWLIYVYGREHQLLYENRCLPSSSTLPIRGGYKILLRYVTAGRLGQGALATSVASVQ